MSLTILCVSPLRQKRPDDRGYVSHHRYRRIGTPRDPEDRPRRNIDIRCSAKEKSGVHLLCLPSYPLRMPTHPFFSSLSFLRICCPCLPWPNQALVYSLSRSVGPDSVT